MLSRKTKTTDLLDLADLLDRQIEGDPDSMGRCVYCDARCNVDSDFHEHCRLEAEFEEQQSALRKKPRSKVRGGWTD